MKNKTFKHGGTSYRAYCKPAGNGYEVGFYCAGTPIFVGNFIHMKEATAWYSEMTRLVQKFTKKYWITPKASRVFYNKFLNHHLYKNYYLFLDKCFSKYTRDYTRQFSRNEKTFKKMQRNWDPHAQIPLKKAA